MTSKSESVTMKIMRCEANTVKKTHHYQMLQLRSSRAVGKLEFSNVDPDPKAPTMTSDDITATSGKTVSCIVI